MIKDESIKKKKIIRGLIVGKDAVGKSSILSRLTDDKFVDRYDATIGVEFGSISPQEKDYKLQVWDTAGKEAFRSITRSYYRGAMVVFIVFDVTSRESFDMVYTFMEEVKSHSDTPNMMMLIAHKTDLPNRKVSTDEGEQFAIDNRMMYLEYSSLANNCTILRQKVYELVDKYALEYLYE